MTLEEKEFKINGYCFYDPKREIEEKNAFYSRIYDVKEKIEETAIPGWRKSRRSLQRKSRVYGKFLFMETN